MRMMLPNRFEWSEIVIVGAVGGVAAACLSLAIRLGASVDNLLNFFGGAVGSGLAVIASLWLESHRRTRALEQMMSSMVITASVAIRFKSAEANSIAPLILTFKQSVEAFEASRLGVTMQNPLHQYAFQTALFWLRRAVDQMSASMDKLKLGEIDERKICQESKTLADNIIGPFEDFLRMKGLPRRPLAELIALKKISSEREVNVHNDAL